MSETTPATPAIPALPALSELIALNCGKCGTDFWVRPVDKSDHLTLHRLSLVGGDSWRDGPGCPMCRDHRGGHYPLYRYAVPGEQEAVAAYMAAVVARELATEPPDLPLNCTDEEDDAWNEAMDAYDELFKAVEARDDELIALGFAGDELWELQERALRDAGIQRKAAGA